MGTLSLPAAGMFTPPVSVGANARVTVTGGYVQWTTASRADILNGNVTWETWPLGTNAGASDTRREMRIRGVSTGAMTLTWADGYGDPGRDDEYWETAVPQWITDANSNPIALASPSGALRLPVFALVPATGDATVSIQDAIDRAQASLVPGSSDRAEVYVPAGKHSIAGISLPSRVMLTGPGELVVQGANAAGVTLTNAVYSGIRDISILLTATGQKALRLVGTGAGSYTQLCVFDNLKIEGDGRPNTLGIEIIDSFSNTFLHPVVLRTALGVTFSTAANANHFFGGEIRGVNTDPDSQHPIVHTATCSANGFHGTIIENWREAIEITGGDIVFDSRCYIEAFLSASCMTISGGTVTVRDNYFNSSHVFIEGGAYVNISSNTFDGASSNAGYPFVQVRADMPGRLIIEDNITVNPAGVIYRPREWFDGTVWALRGAANRNEFHRGKPVRFQARLAADVLNVTGAGADYSLSLTGNEQFDDGGDMGAAFTAPETGIYFFEASVRLAGLVDADHNNITVSLVTSNRTYYLYQQNADINTTADEVVVRGSCVADMDAGDTATLRVMVTGTAATVDILRGDAVNGWTSLAGFIVRG